MKNTGKGEVVGHDLFVPHSGMRLDWSSALIGGGFQFQNPNAVDSCGCGKSFGV